MCTTQDRRPRCKGEEPLIALEAEAEVMAMTFEASEPGTETPLPEIEMIIPEVGEVMRMLMLQEAREFTGLDSYAGEGQVRKLGTLYMISLEPIELKGHSFSFLFYYSEKAAMARILAAMPTAAVAHANRLEAKLSLAHRRFIALLCLEIADTAFREAPSAKAPPRLTV